MSAPRATGKRPSVLWQELIRHAPQYRKVLFFSLIANLLILVPTLFMLQVYDRVVTSRSIPTLLMLLVLVIGAYIAMEALELVRSGIMAKVGLKVDSALRNRLFDSAFEGNLRRGGGDGFGSHLFNDLKTLREFLSSPGMQALLDAPVCLIFLLIKFAIHPLLGMMTLIAALAQVYIAVRAEKKIMPALSEANRASIQAHGYASGALRNTQVIEAMGMMGSIQQRWVRMQQRFLHRQATASDHAGTNDAAGRFLQMMLGSLILGVSCWLHLKGALLGGAGMMIVASILGGRVLAPLVQLVAQWRQVVNFRDAYGRLDEVLGLDPAPEPGMPLPAPKGRLLVEGLVAAAPGSNQPILRGVAFSMQPGEVLVIGGPSGCGKTTLARVMMGVWPSIGGKVRLDGVDVYAWNKDELGPHVGYLPQSVELFDGTLAENIARFGRVDPDKVRAAVAMVGLAGFVEALPDGLDTRLGDDGAFLSGGQRQRVALARAVYGDPKFLVLDEPNASLDDAGEQALVDTLRQLKAAGASTIVISHRPNLLAVADRMVVMREGQVALFGPRDEVLAELKKASEARGQRQASRPPAGPALAQPATGLPAVWPGPQSRGASS